MSRYETEERVVINTSSGPIPIPPIFPTNPDIWFTLIESIFEEAKISSEEEKFCYTVLALDPQYIVEGVAFNTPAEQLYIKFKGEVIKRIKNLQGEKRRLLLKETIGDRKPTEFLNHLRSISGKILKEDMIRAIWTFRLPPYVQIILNTQRDQTLDEVANLADAIASEYRSSEASPDIDLNEKFTKFTLDLRQEIDDLKREVRNLSASLRQILGSSKRSSSRNRQKSNNFCWYHCAFGSNATKCKSPCNY